MAYERPDTYPNGEPIPKDLPPRYQPASNPGVPDRQRCSNCGHLNAKTMECRRFNNAVVRGNYWCAKWEPISNKG